jgi:hypothetical protein
MLTLAWVLQHPKQDKMTVSLHPMQTKKMKTASNSANEWKRSNGNAKICAYGQAIRSKHPIHG